MKKLKHGDIVTWPSSVYTKDGKKRVATTVIAIADDESSFLVALNYKEEGRIWCLDRIPEGANVRKADTIEAGYLLASLMEQGYHVVLTKGGVESVCPDNYVYEQEEASTLMTPSELRSWQFNQYINMLIQLYHQTKSLKGMSKLRDHYHCSAITKEQFFELDLDKLPDNYFWPQAYTDAIFNWATGKTKKKPIIEKENKQ